MNPRHYIFLGAWLLAAVWFGPVEAAAFSSSILYPENGRLTYLSDSEGNRVPDFSHAGYREGAVSLPHAPVRVTLHPVVGDNSDLIQEAIDYVGSLPLDANGLRGAVLLGPGNYSISKNLRLPHSGVVLRGSGGWGDPAQNTILRADRSMRGTVVTVGTNQWGWTQASFAAPIEITSPFVPVGARSFEVAPGSPLQPGDPIIVYHPSTQAWLDAIDGGGPAGGEPWNPGGEDILFMRRITAVSGNVVTIDVPVYNHLDRAWSNSFVYRVNRVGVVTEVGVENLRIHIETVGPTDEEHASNGLFFRGVENGWALGVTVRHFIYTGIGTHSSNFVTVRNCRAIDPHSLITGSRRYAFNATARSNNILFEDCYANESRHCYVSNGTSTVSGIVFRNSVSHRAHAASEGHRRWSQALLFENITFTSPNTTLVLGLYNRGNFGTSHGWSAVHSVAWNCDPGGGRIVVQKPMTGQNYAIGNRGVTNGNGPFNQPVGFIEGTQTTILPASLYGTQLAERVAFGVAPDAPIRLTATGGDEGQVLLAWSHYGTEAGIEFVIERSLGPSGGWSVVGLVAEPARTFEDQPTISGDYGYRVRALGLGGTSAASNPARSEVDVWSDADFNRYDSVIGYAVREQDWGYFLGSGAAHIGSLGNEANRRHQNLVLGFDLPDLPLDQIGRFEVVVVRSGSRNDLPVDLYALRPLEPAVYGDASITPAPDGVDVWHQGPEEDARPGLIGAFWPGLIPAGAADGSTHARDVTDFIRTLYNEYGPLRPTVFFRLSSGEAVPLTALGRTEIVVDSAAEGAPRLRFERQPGPDPEVAIPFRYHFGQMEGEDEADFQRRPARAWKSQENDWELALTGDPHRSAVATTRIPDLAPGPAFGIRARVTLGEMVEDSVEARVGLVLFGQDDPDHFDPDNSETYLVLRWHPGPAGGLLSFGHGFEGDALHSLDLATVSDAPRPEVGMTYTLDFRGRVDGQGLLWYQAMLRDDSGKVGRLGGTHPFQFGSGGRFGFGASQAGPGGVVWNWREFVGTTGWPVDYEERLPPFDLALGEGEERTGLVAALVDRRQDWSESATAWRFQRLEEGSWRTSVAFIPVTNAEGRDFEVETEFTLDSMAASPGFQRVGLAVLGGPHEPFDAPFVSEEDSGFYGLVWYPGGSIRIREGFNGRELATLHAAIPVVVGGQYRLVGTGLYQEDGALLLTLTLHHAGGTYVVATTLATPRPGPLFGIGGRAQPQETPGYSFHRVAVSVVPDPEDAGPGSFEFWRKQHFSAGQLDAPGVSGATADPIGDGVANLIKFTLDRSPWAALRGHDVLTVERGDGGLYLRYEKRTDAWQLSVEPEASFDLAEWKSGPHVFEEVARELVPENRERLTVRLLGADLHSSAFVRLRVSLEGAP